MKLNSFSGRFLGALKTLMALTDVGFLLYWFVTALHLLPPVWLYRNYHDPLVVAWNWSFFPLDVAISLSGLTALALLRRRDARFVGVAIFSLSLTLCSGLQAISFWIFTRDFDASWWLANGFLLVYPLFFLPRLIGSLRVRD